MNENINLSKILKGHEGETFYSPTFGDIKFNSIGGFECCYFESKNNNESYDINFNGTYCNGGEICVFPSKDQRDWNKWIEEQKHKVPKTWSELCKLTNCNTLSVITCWDDSDCSFTEGNSHIEKSALALLKIHQLIEVGYGGNVTYERCASVKYSDVFKIAPTGLGKTLTLVVKQVELESNLNHIMFHELQQAEEFLKYPENVRLLKDYFMLDI